MAGTPMSHRDLSGDADRGTNALLAKLIGCRWVLLVIFLEPVFDPISPFTLADGYAGLVGLMFVSMAACALLLSRLDRPMGETLWAWVLLGLFLRGYYLKSFGMAWKVIEPGFQQPNPELDWVSIHTIAAGFRYITPAFAVVCVASWLALGARRRSSRPPAAAAENLGRKSIELAVGAVMLAAGVGLMQAWLGIGIMGVDYQRLPFRLDTVLFRLRTDIAPPLILLTIWMTDRSRSRGTRLVVLAAPLALALVDCIVTTSRGSFVKLGLPVFFLWLVSGRLTWRRAQLLAVIGAITFLLYPFATALRWVRMQGTGLNWQAVATAAGVAWGEDAVGSFSANTELAADRIGGADGVWFAMGDMPDGIDVGRIMSHLFVEPVHVYFTREVVGIVTPADLRAPGLVGLAMLLGGVPGVILIPAAFVGAIRLLWASLSRLRTAPVALSFVSMTLILIVMEGTLTLGLVVTPLIGVGVTEWVYRKLFDHPAPVPMPREEPPPLGPVVADAPAPGPATARAGLSPGGAP
jgi:hypothetical protein